eukprot:93719-Hanusia_phi.AAC.2
MLGNCEREEWTIRHACESNISVQKQGCDAQKAVTEQAGSADVGGEEDDQPNYVDQDPLKVETVRPYTPWL